MRERHRRNSPYRSVPVRGSKLESIRLSRHQLRDGLTVGQLVVFRLTVKLLSKRGLATTLQVHTEVACRATGIGPAGRCALVFRDIEEGVAVQRGERPQFSLL